MSLLAKILSLRVKRSIDMQEQNLVLDDEDDEWEDLQNEERILEGIP